ncbi:hypothetical protein PSENEW3_00004602 [Picochlorum sp. SENEW3]|nr:hypothetical protein PSENEW3_00004602 [Picochlorum sp. SENEW3]
MCDNGAKDEDISIEQVEGRLWDFQNRLTEYGKDMFGDDFVLMALTDGMESQNKEIVPPKSLDEMIPAVPGRNAVMGKKKALTQRSKKAQESAKSVLLRFLEDREELVRLRVINKAAQDKIQDRISSLEGNVKRIHSIMRDFEKRKKTEMMNAQAFLSELRRKLTSIERRQSRLFAMMTMSDDEKRDAVLQRHTVVEQKETNTRRSDRLKHVAKTEPDTVQTAPQTSSGFGDTLNQLSHELQEIEKCMQYFGGTHQQ